MKLAYTYEDHHSAGVEWQQRDDDLTDWLTNVFEAPTVPIARGRTSDIRKHVESEFRAQGWALNVRLSTELRLEVFATLSDLAFQLQTGNISRVPYDLLKMQYLFQEKRIEAAALALPTKTASKRIGDNIAYAERIIKELSLFDRVITVPILVVAFE